RRPRTFAYTGQSNSVFALKAKLPERLRCRIQARKRPTSHQGGSAVKHRGKLAALAVGLGLSLILSAPAMAQQKPAEIKVGITTFTSGAASVFGVPGKQAAEMLAERINKKGGIQGVPLKLYFIDEGAGAETLTAEYRRLV